MYNENYCIITGMLASKKRNADTPGMKRPVIDIEFVQENNDGSLSFETIPVIFAEKLLVKASQGLHEGDILTISGELRSINNEFCIEADSVSSFQPKEGKMRSLSLSRAWLMQSPQRFNLANVVGVTDKNSCVQVKRFGYSRGDLTEEDFIPVFLLNGNDIPIDARVVCAGSISVDEKSGKLGLGVNKIILIEEHEV